MLGPFIRGIKCFYLHLLAIFYLSKPSKMQFFCFYFEKQNSTLTEVFYAHMYLWPKNLCKYLKSEKMCLRFKSEHRIEINFQKKDYNTVCTWNVKQIKRGGGGGG